MSYSAYLAAIIALFVMGLSLNVSRLRIKHKIALGHKDIKELKYAIRAHGNTLENAVLFIVLLFILDYQASDNGTEILLFGLVFLLSRIVYCIAFTKKWLKTRQISHTLTLLAVIGTAVRILMT